MRWPVARLRQFYTEFSGLLALLLLFSTFRLFAILLFRPGGFFADNSDYDFYSAWGLTQVAMGYTTFETLWTAYPPLSLTTPAAGQVVWILSVLLLGGSSIFGGINFIATIPTSNLDWIFRLKSDWITI